MQIYVRRVGESRPSFPAHAAASGGRRVRRAASRDLQGDIVRMDRRDTTAPDPRSDRAIRRSVPSGCRLKKRAPNLLPGRSAGGLLALASGKPAVVTPELGAVPQPVASGVPAGGRRVDRAHGQPRQGRRVGRSRRPWRRGDHGRDQTGDSLRSTHPSPPSASSAIQAAGIAPARICAESTDANPRAIRTPSPPPPI